MLNLKCPYKTPRELCKDIQPLAEKEGAKLTMRPWNRFKPDLTSWWLVPGTQLPHFKFAKYYFNWGDKNHENLLAGLYVEKGLGEGLASVYSSKKAKSFIMTPDWHWFNVLESLKNKELFNNLKSQCPPNLTIEFIINGGYVTEPTSFDPYQDKNLGWDEYVFNWTPENDLQMQMCSSNRSAFVLKMHHVKTTDDFIGSIVDCSNDQWLWLNTYIAVKLELNPSSEDAETWNKEEIWNNFLHYFLD